VRRPLSSSLRPFCVALVLGALGWPALAGAAGTEIADQSASASGTGGASTARTADPAAAYFNPAALADGQGLRIGLGSSFALASLSASSSPGAPPPAFAIDSEGGVRPIPFFAASYAHRGFAFGLSLHVPFGGGVTWPRDSPLRFEATSSSVRVIRVAPFVGVRLGAVSLAAGPHLDLGQLEVKRATNHVLEEGEVHLRTSGGAVGGQAALFLEATETLAFGLSYKSRSVIRLRGDADFDVPAVFAGDYPDQRVSARLKLPDRFALGVSWSGISDVRLLGDVTYTLWSINDALVFDFVEQETPDAIITNEWRNTVALRAGIEVDVTRAVTARGGAFVDGLFGPAAPARNLGPSSPDMTRVGGSVGVGLQLTDGVAVDAFYSLFRLLERSSTSADLSLATYSGSAHVFGLGGRFWWNPSRD
jgi:long-chain fatty acid transport protein